MENKKTLTTEIGKSLNGKITDCKFCDKKHGFKVCSDKCQNNNEFNFIVYADSERLDLGTNTPCGYFKNEEDALNFAKTKYGKFYIIKYL